MNLQEILLTLAIETKLLIGGLAGAIMGYKGKAGGPIAKAGAFLSGVCAAVWVTPLLYEVLGLEEERSKVGLAVLIGYLGIKGLQQLLIKKLDEWKQ